MDQNVKPLKPVILLNIDSLMPEPLEIAVQTGKAPALKFLMENGRYISHMVSSFPTMSVTIDSSLLTGTYADQHQIPGLNWFDTSKNEIINYGTGFRETNKSGLRKSVHNMLYRLNNQHLSENVRTIYEELADKGIHSASINSFVYRGNTPQKLQVPGLLRGLTRFKDGQWTAEAPSIFSLGVFSKLRKRGVATQIAAGNYKYTARELRHLIHRRKLPGFTFCIFQDLDFRIHFKGPMDIKGISKIDRQIQKTLNLYSSWEEALNQNVWMVMGDNGHAPMGSRYRDFVIDLRKILKKQRIARIQRPIRKKDQVVLSVNQRMAYIYILDDTLPVSTVTEKLKKDARIDIIAWKSEDGVNIESGMRHGSLHFSPGGEYSDMYQQTWHMEGNPELLDLTLSSDNNISYDDYPDGLARIYGALHSQSGRFIVVNAKPGCEFKAQSTPFHLGGAAHGSLHKQETLVPLLIAGTAIKPKYPRFVDMKSFLLELLDR
ncbi:alkaline phosphatase family protein [Lentibacillus amyloliquefaciens]|uniref:Phosphodiesterase n=1 Tax=Lentibacillus amyloliquefaciens TaxID=1472767 RepID=A0A0U3WBI6_9BACI|nr:alkaline phosphatase family protein [Lentibacillus amyloliquefaciens]ALX50416.1 hypothetical protein AOX59_18625 [Lentibacillus amyloliquefaciens]